MFSNRMSVSHLPVNKQLKFTLSSKNTVLNDLKTANIDLFTYLPCDVNLGV